MSDFPVAQRIRARMLVLADKLFKISEQLGIDGDFQCACDEMVEAIEVEKFNIHEIYSEWRNSYSEALGDE